MAFRMDMALFARDDGEARAVVDTKYKIGGVPAKADVQQVVAYAVQLGVRRALLYCIPKLGTPSGLRSVPSQSRRWVLIWRQRISSVPVPRSSGQLQNAYEMPLLVDEKQTQTGKISNSQQATEQDQQKGNGSAIELDDRSLKADAGNKEIESHRWG